MVLAATPKPIPTTTEEPQPEETLDVYLPSPNYRGECWINHGPKGWEEVRRGMTFRTGIQGNPGRPAEFESDWNKLPLYFVAIKDVEPHPDSKVQWIVLCKDFNCWDDAERFAGTLREEMAAEYIAASGRNNHAADCMTSLAPAQVPGPCNCAANV